MKILRTLASYLWMKDNLEFRLRVVAALGFLVGAKVAVAVAASLCISMCFGFSCTHLLCFGFQVLNVQVPFLFKLAVDWLTISSGNAAAFASFAANNSTALALFATPASVLVGYGIARSGSSAFNGTTPLLILWSYYRTFSLPLMFSSLCRGASHYN